MTGRYFT